MAVWTGRLPAAIAIVLVLVTACAGSQGAEPQSAETDALSQSSRSPTVGEAQADAARFVADVLGDRDAAKRHDVIFVGPALHADLVARDPSVRAIGITVTLRSANQDATYEGRMCTDETCGALLRLPAFLQSLRPFAEARYREPTAAEFDRMLEVTPELIPVEVVAVVGVAAGKLLAMRVLEGKVVWLDLLAPESAPAVGANELASAQDTRALLEATQCVKLEAVELAAPEQQFAENTTAEALADGVARTVTALDALLLEKGSRASGEWRLHVTFGPKGISSVAATPNDAVDRSVIDALGERLLRRAPFSRQEVLSVWLLVSLRPCGK